VNPGKTTLEFDVALLYTPTPSIYAGSPPVPTSVGERCCVRFQNNIQSIFSRVRLLYGGQPLEDIPNYNGIVRSLTEWTSSHNDLQQMSITDGIGGIAHTISGMASDIIYNETTMTSAGQTMVGNVRQKYIHGIDTRGKYNDTDDNGATPGGERTGFGCVPNARKIDAPIVTAIPSMKQTNPVRRYQVQLALGLLTQEKLIPTKFMASQLAIEITLASPEDCIYYDTIDGPVSPVKPTYLVNNVNLIPEILEFDASYDESFLRGLQSGGVPIKFSTWNNYRFSNGQATMANLQIQERSRSVKSIFCMQRRAQAKYEYDSGATFFNTNIDKPNGASTLQDYQYRIGGRYFPASPVQNSVSPGGSLSNGGCESYVELAKAINTLGDGTISLSTSAANWALNPGNLDHLPNVIYPYMQEKDYDYGLMGFNPYGAPIIRKLSRAASSEAGDMGSACFAMAIDLETSNGLEISGLNAEEQSDISLIARFSEAQQKDFYFDVFTHIDSMIVLKENNVLILLILGVGTYPVNCVIIIKMVELNPVFEYVELCLDSWDASNSGGTNFEGSTSPTDQIIYSWPQFYFNTKKLVVAGMKVLSVEIPFVYDTVTSINNKFIFTLNGVQTVVTIPEGSYTAVSLAAQLQTLLQVLSPGFLVVWSTSTLRFTFQFTGAAVVWGFIFPPGRQSAYNLMGFLPSTTATLVGPSIITSPTVATPTGPYYLYLNSRSFGSLVNFNLADGAATGSGPEICRIPVTTNFGGVIQYQDPDPEKYFDFFIGNQYTSFDLYLTLGSEQIQKPLDMKGVAWSVKIGLLCYRDATQNLAKRPASMMRGASMQIK